MQAFDITKKTFQIKILFHCLLCMAYIFFINSACATTIAKQVKSESDLLKEKPEIFEGNVIKIYDMGNKSPKDCFNNLYKVKITKVISGELKPEMEINIADHGDYFQIKIGQNKLFVVSVKDFLNKRSWCEESNRNINVDGGLFVGSDVLMYGVFDVFNAQDGSKKFMSSICSDNPRMMYYKKMNPIQTEIINQYGHSETCFITSGSYESLLLLIN